MLLSMTGFGEAKRHLDRLTVNVEVRTVNNRYLKVMTRLSDVYAALEGEIERVVRERIGRGTVNVQLRVDRLALPDDYQVNLLAVMGYLRQLSALESVRDQQPSWGELIPLLSIPGVIVDQSRQAVDVDADWLVIRPTLIEALERLELFRRKEGESMQADLVRQTSVLQTRLTEIQQLAPQVPVEYRQKLLERIRTLLSGTDVTISEPDLIREVSLFADKADINEELTRLRCHLDQFHAFVAEKESTGRKLEFLVQEIFREVNTIGSKANSVSIAHAVVDMKAAVDRLREVLQNVE